MNGRRTTSIALTEHRVQAIETPIARGGFVHRSGARKDVALCTPPEEYACDAGAQRWPAVPSAPRSA